MSNIIIEEKLSDNKYTAMQKSWFQKEGETKGAGMDKNNHTFHNGNPDYWDILVKDTTTTYNPYNVNDYTDKMGLDFGCGCGRNILSIANRFKRFDGVDISSNLIDRTRDNLNEANIKNSELYVCNGTDLDIIDDEQYDFIMSTIVMQHICVYDIRYSYLKEFYRILKTGGLLSFQMGYGRGHGKVEYHENFYDATETNGRCDVIVDNPEQITTDLEKIGFTDISYQIRSSFSDKHPQWIFVKAKKG